MKTLIVDDERHAREAIRMLIDWSRYGIRTVLEAESVEEAVRLIDTENPEIIFTDMVMPGHDGIELLSWISAKAPASKIIVVSGYKDFYYVRNTVKFGGLDYVLKPIDPDQIQEVLDKAVRQWHEEAAARGQVMESERRRNKIRFLYWDQFFSRLLQQARLEASAVQEFLAEFGLRELPERAQVVTIDTVWLHPRLLKRLSGNTDLLHFILHNISNEYLLESQAGFAFQDLNRKGIAMIIWKTESASFILERINKGMLKTFGMRLHFGVGDPAAFPGALQHSYEQGLHALSERNLLREDSFIHLRHTAAQPAKANLHRLEQLIGLALYSGIEQSILDATAEWFNQVERLDCMTPKLYEEWWKEFVVFINRWNTDHLNGNLRFDWPMPFYVPIDSEGRLSFELWRERVASTLLLLSRAFAEASRREKHVVYDIARYLEENYMEEKSIQEIAHMFGISKEHLSRKFKQELKMTPSDFVTDVRMKHARLLLANPWMKVNAVALRTGYQDEKYFSKVFKKWTGMTPHEYRKTLSLTEPHNR